MLRGIDHEPWLRKREVKEMRKEGVREESGLISPSVGYGQAVLRQFCKNFERVW